MTTGSARGRRSKADPTFFETTRAFDKAHFDTGAKRGIARRGQMAISTKIENKNPF